MTAAIGKIPVCPPAGTPCATSVLLSSECNSGADISRDRGPRLTFNTRLTAATLAMRSRTCRPAETSPPDAGLVSSKKADSPVAAGMNRDHCSLTDVCLVTARVPNKCSSGCGEGGCHGVGDPNGGSADCRRSINEPICEDMFWTTGCYFPCASRPSAAKLAFASFSTTVLSSPGAIAPSKKVKSRT